MGKFHIGRNDDSSESMMIEPLIIINAGTPVDTVTITNSTPTIVSSIPEEKIVYVDRPVETIKEVIVEVEKIVEVPGKTLIEYKTVEVPVLYEKEVIKEVPVYIEKEVKSKVVDITEHLEIKRKIRTNKRLKACLALSVILNVILMAVI